MHHRHVQPSEPSATESSGDSAKSDAAQQITPDVLEYILDLLVVRDMSQGTESLSQLRKEIDECDNALIETLSKRMRVSREIGEFKKEHNMTILQRERYDEIIAKRCAQGMQCGMGTDFMRKIFEAIHEESVNQQMEVLNK